MPSFPPTLRRTTALAAVTALAGLTAGPAPAAEIDASGGITLTVSFEKDANLAGSLDVPVRHPDAQAHYCAIFEKLSEELYLTTEGTHWLKRVRFFEELGPGKRDITWNFIAPRCGMGMSSDCPADSFASYRNYLKLRENAFDPALVASPFVPSRWSIDYLAQLVEHEFGHYFYDLPDEYVNFKGFRGGNTGFCANKYMVVDNLASGKFCDEEATTCDPNVDCIFMGQCIAGTKAQGTPCERDVSSVCSHDSSISCTQDSDCDGDARCKIGCGTGGICLGMNENRTDKIDGGTMRICNGETNLSLGTSDRIDEVCLMWGAGRGRRWCDGGLLPDDSQSPAATHVFTSPAGGSYDAGTVNFDLGNTVGEPWWEYRNERLSNYRSHSCWHDAGQKHIDLVGAHPLGADYSELASLDPLPPTACDWIIDTTAPGNHTALLIDRSGSMGYLDQSDPPVPALSQAMDGALYVYNEAKVPFYIGAYLFNDATIPASTGGTTGLEWQPKLSSIPGFDPVAAQGGTDIAVALATAITDILSSPAPAAIRNIILFTDGKHNGGGDPYEQAEVACDASIHVYTIGYGDADSAALDKLSECAPGWVTGTGPSGVPLPPAEPDPLEVKSSLARMGHLVEGDLEVIETRDDLEPLTASTVETREFVVPEDTGRVTFSWLANRTCVLAGPPPTTCEPVLNLLDTVEIESPGGMHYPAVLDAAAAGGVYRTISVDNPEAGTWIARIDKSEPAIPPSTLPGEWEDKVAATRVTWTGHISHGSLRIGAWAQPRRGPVDGPVLITAQMGEGAVLSDLTATATVSHAGQVWTLPMFDKDESGTITFGDGVHGAVFNPDGTWTGITAGAYRVKVRLEAIPGVSRSLYTGEDNTNEGDPFVPEILQDPGHIVLEAETYFRLADRYTVDPDGRESPGTVVISCPDLLQGQTYPGLVADVSGIQVDIDTLRMSLGPGLGITIDSATCSQCADMATDPGGPVTFSVAVDPAAATGPRDLRVQDQLDIVTSPAACRVCAAPGLETCNAIDDDCNGLVDDDGTILDPDLDLLPGVCDNCLQTFNPGQADMDMDGEGDACDVDDGLIYTAWDAAGALSWQIESRATSWNVYRGDLQVLRAGGSYSQIPGSSTLADRFCALASPFLVDSVSLLPGDIAFYLVTNASAEDLGADSAGSPRPHDNPCPTGPPTF